MNVLVLEDDDLTAELLEVRLEMLGCTMLRAKSEDEALRMAGARRPDLAIIDLRLGKDELAGVRVIEALRHDPVTAGIPVVVHSIFIRERSDNTNLARRVDNILPKPFSFLDLKNLIEGLREAASAHQGD